MPKRNDFFGLLLRPAETMENSAHFPPVIAHDLERVFPRIALMNDNVQPQLDSQIELLLKQTGLFAFQRSVVDLAFDFLLRFALQRARKNLRFALARDG